MCTMAMTVHKPDGSGDKQYTTEFTGMKDDGTGGMKPDKKAIKKTMKVMRKHVVNDYKQPLV